MKPIYAYFKAGLFLFALISSNLLYSQATTLHVFQEWAKNDGLSEHVYKATSAYDNTGCLYVVGAGMSAYGDYNWLITKYNTSGVKIWSVSYDAGANNQNDILTDIVIDANCNLYVVGATSSDSTSFGYDLGVGCFDSSGANQWITTYDNGQSSPLFNDAASSITMDNSGYIYVTGVSQDNSTLEDIVTLQYDMATGSQQWVQLFDDTNDRDMAVNISIFTDNSVLVSGATERNTNEWGAGSLEYQLDGTLLTNNFGSYTSFDSISEVYDVAIANNGDIYMVGSKRHGTFYDNDVKLLKFDSLLNYQWSYNWYNGGKDAGTSVKVDEDSGYVYVGGYKYINGTDLTDYIIYKVDTSGSIDWEENYNMGSGDIGRALALDNQGNPIITGYSWNLQANNYDYYTLKANQSDGSEIWNINYNGLANKDDQPSEIALDYLGNIYVIGQSEDSSGTTSSYITVKYVEHELYNVFDTIPTSFSVLPNLGQLQNSDTTVNTTVKYYAKDGATFFENDKIVYKFLKIDTSSSHLDTTYRVDMVLTSDTTTKVYSQNKLDFYCNFFYPHLIVTNGLSNVPNYEKVVYPEIYKDIDLNVSSNQKGIKNLFVVKPSGGDPNDIKFYYNGSDTIYVDGSGNLNIVTLIGSIKYERPICSQIDSSGNYVTIGWQPYYKINGDTVTFDSISTYNMNLPLVIEMRQTESVLNPATGVCWSTFFGGQGDDWVFDSHVDQYSNLYVVGQSSNATFFPFTAGVIQTSWAGVEDGVIAKFNEDHSPNFATFYGGAGKDLFHGVDVDPSGYIYIAGASGSTGMQGALNSFSGVAGDEDAFIAKIRFDGQQVFWSRYVGGTFIDGFWEMDINPNDATDIVAVGRSVSSNFPVISSSGGSYSQPHSTTFRDAILVKINSSGTLIRSTCFGGDTLYPNADDYFASVLFDGSGDIFVCGYTESPNFPQPATQPPGAYVDTIVYDRDALIVKFSNNTNLLWSTTYGGNSYDDEEATSLEIGTGGELFITGITQSPPPYFNTVPNGLAYYDSTYGGGLYDAFFMKFNTSLGLDWCTYYGGSGDDRGVDIHVKDYWMYATGFSSSTNLDMPVGGNPPNTYTENSDVVYDPYVLAFDPSQIFTWGTYIPGNKTSDQGQRIETDGSHLYLLSVQTSTANFPVYDGGSTIPYFQGSNASDTTTISHDIGITCFDRFAIATGIENPVELSNGLTIYPNPAQTTVWLRSEKPIESWEIFDLTGRKVLYSFVNCSELTSVDVSMLPAGIYFVRAVVGSKLITAKFIIV